MADALLHTEQSKVQDKLEHGRRKIHLTSAIVLILCLLLVIFELVAIADTLAISSVPQIRVIVFTASIAGLFVAPTAVIKQYILSKMGTLRCELNKMRMEVNRLTQEHIRLQHHVDALQGEVHRMQHVEEGMMELSKESKGNIDDMVSIVNENQTVVKRIAQLARAKMQEDLLTAVLRTDGDQNMRLEAHEVDTLIMRMRCHVGIVLNEEKFRKKIEHNRGSLWSVLKVVRDLGEDDWDLGGSEENFDDNDGVRNCEEENDTGSGMSAGAGTGRCSARSTSRDSAVSVDNKKLLKIIHDSDREMNKSSTGTFFDNMKQIIGV